MIGYVDVKGYVDVNGYVDVIRYVDVKVIYSPPLPGKVSPHPNS